MAAMAWNWETALISAGIVCVLVAFIALLWQRRYVNDTNTISNCRCGCERVEISECAESYQPATGCSKCHRRISSPTVTRTNCQDELDFGDCPCGSQTVRRLKCAKCCQPTIGCSECYRRLAPCVCDKPRRQCTYYPDPQMEGFGRDFAAMLGISNNRCATSSNLRSFETNDAIHRYTVRQQQEGDLERVNSQIEEYKKALRELDDVDNNQSKVQYWTTTNQSKEQQPITRTIANQSKVQYWSDLLNGDRNIEKRHVQKFKVDREVQRAKTLHSQKRSNREQPPRATVQESAEQTSADNFVRDLKEYLDFCHTAKSPPCPPTQESQEKNDAQNLVMEMKTRMKALVRSHRSTPCPPRPLGSRLNALRLRTLREVNEEEIGHTVKPTYHQPFKRVQDLPHDLGKANAEIEHFRKALRELDEEDMANQPIQQQKDRNLVQINAEIADYKNALQVLNKAEMIQKPKRVQQRSEKLAQANAQIEEYRETLRVLDEEDMPTRPVQPQNDRDVERINAEIADYKNALAAEQPTPQPYPKNRSNLDGDPQSSHKPKRVHRRSRDLDQTNAEIEEHREALRELDEKDLEMDHVVSSINHQSYSPELECATCKLPPKEIQRAEKHAHWEDRLENYKEKKKRPIFKDADRDLQRAKDLESRCKTLLLLNHHNSLDGVLRKSKP